MWKGIWPVHENPVSFVQSTDESATTFPMKDVDVLQCKEIHPGYQGYCHCLFSANDEPD